MIYSPILEVYFRHEKRIHDFFVQIIVTLAAYTLDYYLFSIPKINIPSIGLPIFLFGYGLAYYLIRFKRKERLFKVLGEYSLKYTLFMSIWAWLGYYFFVRLPRFQ